MLSALPLNTVESNGYIGGAGKNNTALESAGRNRNISHILSAEYYSSEKLDLSYTSKDGDTLTLSAEYIEYQKMNMSSEISWEGGISEDTINKIIEELESMHDKAVSQLLDKTFGTETEETEKAENTKIKGLPEYWNAENTSQRIVDFATSFLSMFEGKDSEFYDMVKGAVEEGFSQALGELGELPDEISGLIDDTHSLTMEKLDQWAEQQGIEIKGRENSEDEDNSAADILNA